MNTEKNPANNLVIRKAEAGDAETVLFFIKQLADYEKLSHEVKANVDTLKQNLFSDNSNANAVLAFYNNEPVGFALYFYNFSTFLGKRGIYLEDLFVLPDMRGKGFGKKLFLHLIAIAKKNNCGRFEFSVLDWNEPSIKFYKSLGAESMDDWTAFRIDENRINKLTETYNFSISE
ncbi:MAG: GNAT family N-acetyltransferase [Ignavibacteriae bacterium]|nr:GNAT family N-acetyltransferase [Ignavibacteriota bacterium]NOG97962.1 GNAT family N-acetyltransferase [Ignavibacteriota bacterium]